MREQLVRVQHTQATRRAFAAILAHGFAVTWAVLTMAVTCEFCDVNLHSHWVVHDSSAQDALISCCLTRPRTTTIPHAPVQLLSLLLARTLMGFFTACQLEWLKGDRRSCQRPVRWSGFQKIFAGTHSIAQVVYQHTFRDAVNESN